MSIHISRFAHSGPPRFGRLAQALMLALVAGSAEAATYRVDTEAALVQAIANANAHDDTDRILVRHDIVLHAALPAITHKLSIEGTGGRRAIRRDDDGPNACSPTAANPFRLLDATADLTLADLTLSGGCLVSDQGGANQGGGVRVTDAHLRVERSTISGNQTFVNGDSQYDFGLDSGGGIASIGGSITLVDSRVSNNATHADYFCMGGGVLSFYGSSMEITGSTISGNETHCLAADGGGIFAISDSPVPDTLAIASSGITDNHAFGDYAIGGGVAAVGENNLTITGSVVTGNTLDSGACPGNTRGAGVSVYNGDVGYTRIEDTLISANRIDDGCGAFGGGVHAYGGTFELVRSTVAGNIVNGIDRARGGGMMIEMNHTMVVDSTISDNKTAGLPDVTGGGGVMVLSELNAPADFETINSTIAGNDATSGIAGGVLLKRETDTADSPTVLFESSLVAGNRAASGPDEIDVADETATAPVVVAHHSLFQGAVDVGPGTFEADSITVALLGSDPLLQPLADNGGPTPTQALPCGSPAINQGTNVLNLRFDQRGHGFPRKTGRKVDVGAVETRCQH